MKTKKKKELATNFFCNFYRKLKNNDKNLVRFFERKSDSSHYYTVHGSNALFIGEEYYRTLETIKKLGPKGKELDSISVSSQMFASILRDLLLVKRFRVEVYNNPGTTQSEWKIIKRGSPGNVRDFEEILFAGASSDSSNLGVWIDSPPIVMAIHLIHDRDNIQIGVAFCDSTLHTIGITSIEDNSQLTTLESVCVQIGARECLILASNQIGKMLNYPYKKALEVLQRCGVILTERSKKEFPNKINSIDLEKDLSILINNSQPSKSKDHNSNKFSLLQIFEKHSSAMPAANTLVSYLGLLDDEQNNGTFRISTFDPMLKMRIDSTAFEALNLFPSREEHFSQSKTQFFTNDQDLRGSSLIGLLNRCCTKIGSRKLSLWIKQPSIQLEEIVKRHLIVESFVKDNDLRITCRDIHLHNFPDIPRINNKFQRGTANLSDVIRMFQVTQEIIEIIQTFANSELNNEEENENENENEYENEKDNDNKIEKEGEIESQDNKGNFEIIKTRYIEPLIKIINFLSKFIEMVKTVVDLKAYERDKEYMINCEYNEELAELSENREGILKKINKYSSKIKNTFKSLPPEKVYFENSKSHGYYFRVTKTNHKHVRGHKDIIQIENRKNGIKFTTKKLQKLNSQLNEIQEDYQNIQEDIVNGIITVCQGFGSFFDQLSEIVSEIDVLLSFATVATESTLPYIKPAMLPMEEQKIILKESRHPCVEVQEGVTFIPNDLSVNANSSFVFITGPNCFGKSTYIKQIGMIILMAQIGSFVPCTEATISIRDCILARVGAGDRQLQGVSTFQAEMLEASSILQTATKHSLIIIDELGRGTSTTDGFGLAWAFSEHISKKIGSITLFATHFHELTSLSKTVPNISNLHVSSMVTKNTVIPMYKVKHGSSDQSLGIRVAEIVKFPQSIIENAKLKHTEIEKHENELKRKAKMRLLQEIEKEQSKSQKKELEEEREKQIEGGKQLILDFLKGFESIPFDQLAPRQAYDQLTKIKDELLKKNNPFIDKIITETVGNFD
ncbi:DNA mismatch repair protein msh2 [Anaeramoeba flamelloides]|uniref:DNA mismatch repair protein msh2 n=1 Tax=Anaeramoeba flamelloides TaxID=1746091 RepID=A0AAV7ZL70_9EUKA|nr:DNA mismatch repair protein msh2 [Anaeramoeba flamelloides]